MKKIIGPVVFALTLCGAVALTVLFATRPPAPSTPAPAPLVDADANPHVFFKPRFATLDFAARRSHVTLELERDASRPAPASVWVWAYFFQPGAGAYYCSGDPVEVRRPFSTGDRVTVTVQSEFQGCATPRGPATTFYTRVNVSTESGFAARFSESRVSFDITSATPVVVQGAGR